MNMKKEIIMGISIPIIFTVGVYAFFSLIPSEFQTLSNFISYTSSLSTILMVLVVIATTSLQLKEMSNARLLQTQPFPSIIPSKKSYIEELSFFRSFPISKTVLERRLFFNFEIENIGDGPIVAIDIIPRLRYTDGKDEIVTIEPVWERVDSLKQNQKEEFELMFTPDTEDRSEMARCIMKRFVSDEFPCGGSPSSSSIELIILYKNVLGASFRQTMHFDIFLYEEDKEKVKSCLKLLEIAGINYVEQIKKLDLLYKSDKDKASETLEKLNEEISKKEGCGKVYCQAVARHGMFSIKPISEKEYRKEMQARTYGRLIGIEKDAEFFKVVKEN
jgi:hypothetical protein